MEKGKKDLEIKDDKKLYGNKNIELETEKIKTLIKEIENNKKG